MKLAIQLYSVRDEMEKDFFGTLKRVKEMGYDGCEFAGLYGKDPKEIKKACDELGLTPISAHVAYYDVMQDINKAVNTYKEVGCKYMVIPYLPEDLRYGTEKYAQAVEDFKEIGKICKENGLTLLYHNHDFEFEKDENGDYVLDALYNEVCESILKTEIDTCWVNVGGEDPSAYVRKYTGRAPIVHLKDFTGDKNEHMYELIGIESEKKEVKSTFEFRPLGYGKQNIGAIVDAARDAGAGWVVAEMDSPSMGLTPMECMQKSIEYMQTINY
jgi:sugar phosphate isomerase/epimerase